MSKTGPWESDEGEAYLTTQGYQALKNYSLRQDIFRPFCYMQFYQQELKKLRINDIVIGPAFNDKKNKHNLFKLNHQGKFIKIPCDEITEDNIKLIRSDLIIYDGSWFSWRGILYFASSNFCNIEKLSIYYTEKGLNYLLQKRQNYLYVLNNPHLFGPNQIKAFTTIPKNNDWW